MTRNRFCDPFANERLPEQRKALARVFVPGLFEQPGRVLYIGANPRLFELGKNLYDAGNKLTVLEIWPPNVEGLRASIANEWIEHLVEGDVRNISQITLPHESYDYTLWWHGPEHVERALFEPIMSALELLTERVVIIGTPWGTAYWPAEDGNPHQEHLSWYYPKDFARLGYRLVALWPENEIGSHMMAWKVCRRN